MGKRVYLDNTIEFLKGRVYLGAYDYAPQDSDEVVFFTVEDTLFYNRFHLDFGPMHIGHLYRFAVIFHEILNDPENHGKAVVFYSSTSTRQRANTACLLCCYMVLVQGWTPHQVLQPLARVAPPFMPFRDAGYSNADFEITIQDVVYGIWRAKETGLVDLNTFRLEVYEKYERVENGDFNVLTPDFIAFASPEEDMRRPYVSGRTRLNQPFKRVLEFFKDNNVQLVVRLNSHLYRAQHFEDIGIKHLDMIFEDGTCPDLSIVKNFVGAAETIINQGGKIAVHCKAGLGRTGCLIGAHLIYTYGFTANECIGFLRFIRPGMVVGPQQHWIYLNQNTFREWKYTMKLSIEPSDLICGLYPLVTLEEYKLQKKALRKSKADREGDYTVDENTVTPPNKTLASRNNEFSHTNAVPQESPGQPRKGQDGSNTIEDINNKTKPVSSNGKPPRKVDENTSRVHHSNNSDNEEDSMLIDSSNATTKSPLSSMTKKQTTNTSMDDEFALRQILPKNRRLASSGLATTDKRSASGAGVRKVSGTAKR
ncbi:AaceriAEL025Wp [[Ashbya] aceris (nom. inval.)]|nr:AaceriAEL025Wp [[Ashbya] aceris (nom. inval.)]